MESLILNPRISFRGGLLYTNTVKNTVEIEKKIKVSDPVYSFSEVLRHIDLNKYLTVEERRTGRPRYCSPNKTLPKLSGV